MIEVVSNIPIMQLYMSSEAYLWVNKREILEACDVISSKDMTNPCPLLDNFLEFGRKKEEKKEQRQILRLIDGRSNEIEDGRLT
jgi:hypothetical protein